MAYSPTIKRMDCGHEYLKENTPCPVCQCLIIDEKDETIKELEDKLAKAEEVIGKIDKLADDCGYYPVLEFTEKYLKEEK